MKKLKELITNDKKLFMLGQFSIFYLKFQSNYTFNGVSKCILQPSPPPPFKQTKPQGKYNLKELEA